MQVCSCEYCITFKNTYFEEHLQTAASEREALVFLKCDFEVLPSRYNGNFSMEFLYFLSGEFFLLGFFC